MGVFVLTGGKLYECQSCDFTAVGKMDLEFHYRKEHQLTAAMAREAVRTCGKLSEFLGPLIKFKTSIILR